MSLESRAGRAAHSIRKSVGSAQPAGVGAITRRHRLSMATAVAFVGILAGASVAFAAMMPGAEDEQVAATTITAPETTSTLPSEPGPPIVVVPSDGEDGTEMTVPEGATVLVLAGDDLDSLTGSRWDDWTFGLEGWETTTTTKPEEGETTTTTKPVVTTISAHQYYGPATNKPYEKIYGTAPPGTRVRLTSPYGSAEGTVGSSGEYYLKVYFSGQPANEYFTITANVGEKTYYFQYKWTGSYEITAMQYYGPENTDRKDKVYGTAPPGTVVIATSDYGSSDLTVGESGEYWLHIYFDETLPANEWITWTAKLKDPSGTVLLSKTFDFKWVVSGGEASMDRCVYPAEYENRYQKVCGWAPEGAVVELTSEYGTIEQAVSGDYHVKIHFNESVPPDVPITWTAKMWIDGSVAIERSYQFTWTPTWDVTASQYYGPEHDQRYDKVYGTAPPGTIVLATSDYGSADMVVGAGGDYYLKIHFNESLPAEQEISWTATLKDPGGTVLLTKTFSFTYLPNYDISANQKWGPESPDATEKIYGTAAPGNLVSVTSPYASASTTVGGSGEWSVILDFIGQPANEAFTIEVSVDGTPFTTFSFTHVVD